MKAIAKKGKMLTFKVLLLAAIILLSGCATSAFHYDPAAFPGAKP